MFVDALKEAPALLGLGEVQEELDDAGAVAVQVLLEFDDGTVPALPERRLFGQLGRQALGRKDLGVNLYDEDLLVIGPVEDPDPASRGQAAGRAPQEIMLGLLGAGMLEAVDLASLRVDPAQDV